MNDILEFQGENRWLSNFMPVDIRYDDLDYKTVENAYQAAKTLNRLDKIEISLASPGMSKKMGRRVVMRKDWHDIKITVMAELIRQKFEDPMYKKLLLDTGDCKIVEGNRWNDTYWGVCNGVGKNILGELIMATRKLMIDKEMI